MQQNATSGKHFTEKELMQIIENIASGLKVLQSYSSPIIHRNICVSYFFLGVINNSPNQFFWEVKEGIKLEDLDLVVIWLQIKCQKVR